MTASEIGLAVGGLLLTVFLLLRSIAQPDEPWFKWGPPVCIAVLTAFGVAQWAPGALVAAVLALPFFAADRLWRTRHDAGVFF